MYKYPILLLFLFVAFVFCHEVCIDSSYPGNVSLCIIPLHKSVLLELTLYLLKYVNSWCTDYSGHSCCNATVDAQIQQRYNGFAIPAADTKCQTMMHKIFCGQWYYQYYPVYTYNGKRSEHLSKAILGLNTSMEWKQAVLFLLFLIFVLITAPSFTMLARSFQFKYT